MTDEYKRYLAMGNIVGGKYAQGDIDALTGSREESPIETLSREQIADWGKYTGTYRGEERTYIAPSDGIWASGRDILVENAYRVVSEEQDKVQVRKVQGSEIEAVVNVCRQGIRRMLNKRTGKEENQDDK